MLQTKVSPESNPHTFRRNFLKSMRYLQQDSVDLFALHGVNDREVMRQAMRPGGCLEEARKLQKDGWIKHLGFSTHASCNEIVELIQSGEFDYVNLHWYFVNQLNTPAIVAAAKQDMGVFIISPNDKGGRLYDPPPKLVDLCHPLHPMQFNDCFCWANPDVHTISCGVTCPEDFDVHLEALEHFEDAKQVITPIIERIRLEVEKQFGPTWFENWSAGIPDWQELPSGINVKDILRLWTWAQTLDLQDFAHWRYNMLGTSGHWVPGHPVSPFDEGEMKEALRESPFADVIPGLLLEAHQHLAGNQAKRLSQS